MVKSKLNMIGTIGFHRADEHFPIHFEIRDDKMAEIVKGKRFAPLKDDTSC